MTSLLDLYKILNTICFCAFLLGDKDKEIHNLSDCELENEEILMIFPWMI
jgi:hypothetical protein